MWLPSEHRASLRMPPALSSVIDRVLTAAQARLRPVYLQTELQAPDQRARLRQHVHGDVSENEHYNRRLQSRTHGVYAAPLPSITSSLTAMVPRACSVPKRAATNTLEYSAMRRTGKQMASGLRSATWWGE